MKRTQSKGSVIASACTLFRANEVSKSFHMRNQTSVTSKKTIWSSLKVLLVAGSLVLAKSVFAADTPGSVIFNTRVAGVVDAKVSRPDGTGAGAGVQAQLFLVGSDGSVTGLTPATTFRTE